MTVIESEVKDDSDSCLDDDITHVICCEFRLGDQSFCGIEVGAEGPWGATPVECIDCFAKVRVHWCPKHGTCHNV